MLGDVTLESTDLGSDSSPFSRISGASLLTSWRSLYLLVSKIRITLALLTTPGDDSKATRKYMEMCCGNMRFPKSGVGVGGGGSSSTIAFRALSPFLKISPKKNV